MPNKTLTAKVRLDISDAESKLKRLTEKISSLNRAVKDATKVDNTLNKNIAHYDKLIQKEHQLAIQKQRADTAEQARLDRKLAAENKLALAKEKFAFQQEKHTARQQATTDRAIQKQLEKERRLQQQAQLARMEWEKSHTILSKITNALDKSASKLNNMASKNQLLNSKWTKANSLVTNVANKLTSWATKIRSASTSNDRFNTSLSRTNSLASSVWTKLKGLAATYLGIMGTKAVVKVADTITSAENQLNYVTGDSSITQEAMDKTYAAAQRSRGDYLGMLSNVGKTMTLAGDAFQNNVDNAIRFQEIMSKAYTVGGSSAAEQASSMYQLVQALGSGVLQGDELRSLREGAALAYKEIEKFAQGVFNSEESLKDLASKGLITSDIVVAAIMNSEKKIEEAFNDTEMTFTQALTKMKNVAVQAFKPVLQRLTDILNSRAGQAAINAISNALVGLANVVMWIIDIFAIFFNWCAANWYWLKYIVIAVLTAIVSYLIFYTAVSIANAVLRIAAWMAEHWQMLLILLTIGLLVAGIVWLANTTADGCEFMVAALGLVAIAIMLIGVITGSTALIIIGIIIALVAVFIAFAQQIVGAIYWAGAVCANIGLAVANFFVACWNWLGAAWHNTVSGIVNVGMGLWNSLQAIATNIGIAFQNAWIWAKNTFWEFIADVLDGVSKLEPVINGIAKLLGKDGIDISGAASSMRAKKQEYKSFVSVSDAWASGMSTREYQSLGDAWSSGLNTFQYKDTSAAYNKGAEVGRSIQDKVGTLGDSIKNKITGISGSFGDVFKANDLANGVTAGAFTGAGNLLDNIGNLADDSGRKSGGLSGGKGSKLPNPKDPAYSLADAYDPAGANDDINNALNKLNGGVDDISGNTGSIADNMELTQEDLEYLRKIADMEWKKEYTTASITVDMSNYNTINGDSDLDGIVTKLTSRLYEELDSFANGVYA